MRATSRQGAPQRKSGMMGGSRDVGMVCNIVPKWYIGAERGTANKLKEIRIFLGSLFAETETLTNSRPKKQHW